MSMTHHNDVPGESDTSGERRLAHELANLMDGSMRNVSLLASTLRAGAAAGRTPGDDVLRRLDIVEQGMRRMATLVKRWMEHGGESPASLHEDGRSLGAVIGEAVEALRPVTDAMRIEVNARVSPAVAAMPAGPLEPLVVNGLRNAVEAIGLARTQGRPCGRVDIVARRDGDAWVELSIADDGTGVAPELFDGEGVARFGQTTKATGHGLGLALCGEIARELGGTLSLGNRDYGGAVLTLRFPVR